MGYKGYNGYKAYNGYEGYTELTVLLNELRKISGYVCSCKSPRNA